MELFAQRPHLQRPRLIASWGEVLNTNDGQHLLSEGGEQQGPPQRQIFIRFEMEQ
jgi:hypothetical protein